MPTVSYSPDAVMDGFKESLVGMWDLNKRQGPPRWVLTYNRGVVATFYSQGSKKFKVILINRDRVVQVEQAAGKLERKYKYKIHIEVK